MIGFEPIQITPKAIMLPLHYILRLYKIVNLVKINTYHYKIKKKTN
jgi:hypothetical protein